MTNWKNKPDSYWKQKLSPEQYKVTRKAGTEKPFSGTHHNEDRKGLYTCVCCGNELFHSDAKYDSGTGWPSFYDGLRANLQLKDDRSLFRRRTEVVCDACDAHLGHVFKDGPEPTGKRYCINSAALDFQEDQ